jgi:alanine dehydrogenase
MDGAPRLIGPDDVRRLLPMPECIELMADALAALGRGEALQPLRTVVTLPDARGALYVMPAWSADPPALAVKLVSVFPGNHARGLPSHQGVVALFDAADGSLRALLDGAAVTAVRTAAVSGLATRLLARDDAADLAILGSGVQAASHLEAMRCVRAVRRVRVWSPTPAHREAFAREQAARHGIDVAAVADAERAVAGADIVCTVTGAADPVLHGEWLAPGAHVNAVGASSPRTRELDGAAVAAARLFVDRRESALAEAGDVLLARAEGALAADTPLTELADVLLGAAPGRRHAGEITIFKSLGLAVEDAAAAARILANAGAGPDG